jgi:hypothetical protein
MYTSTCNGFYLQLCLLNGKNFSVLALHFSVLESLLNINPINLMLCVPPASTVINSLFCIYGGSYSV